MAKNKYIALIPAYKPAPFLLDLTKGLEKRGFSVVIVDDGSGIGYEYLFLECSRYAEILYHPQNAGKGCVLKTGLYYIVQGVLDIYGTTNTLTWWYWRIGAGPVATSILSSIFGFRKSGTQSRGCKRNEE